MNTKDKDDIMATSNNSTKINNKDDGNILISFK